MANSYGWLLFHRGPAQALDVMFKQGFFRELEAIGDEGEGNGRPQVDGLIHGMPCTRQVAEMVAVNSEVTVRPNPAVRPKQSVRIAWLCQSDGLRKDRERIAVWRAQNLPGPRRAFLYRQAKAAAHSSPDMVGIHDYGAIDKAQRMLAFSFSNMMAVARAVRPVASSRLWHAAVSIGAGPFFRSVSKSSVQL
jgi:hypothetical protein